MTPLIALALLATSAAPAEAVVPPRLVGEAPRPRYPEGETRAARVVLSLQIDATGAVRAVDVVPPEQPPFDTSAIAAARALQFVPASLREKPIAVRIQYAFQFTPPSLPRQGELTGSLRERGSRRKMSGVEIAVGDQTGITDAEGRFAVTAVAEGKQRVVVAAPGYKRFQVEETISDRQRLDVAYLIEPVYASPYEATVIGERARREISKTTISMAEIERVPGTQGDALKIIEDLPGVARTSPIGGGQLVVRGSKPGDSLVYLDGQPIPQLYHFFALSSTVNPDLLSGIDFLPGNFGASYGDLTGGLVEVKTRSLRDELHGYANLNMMESSVLLEGPLGKDWSFAIAGRRSYIDAILGAAMGGSSDTSFTAAPRYYDGQFRLDYRPQGSAHQFSFLALTSSDHLGMLFKRPISDDPNQTGGLDVTTGFSQFRLKHRWQSGALSLDTVAMFETLEDHTDVGSENLHIRARSLMLRSTGSLQASDALGFSLGVDVAARRYTVNARVPRSGYRLEGEPDMARPDEAPTVVDQQYDRYTPAIWAEARWKILPRLTLTPGIRLDDYFYFTDKWRRTETLSPRLAARWEATEALAFKGGVGLYTQGPRDADPMPVLGNPDIKPERALEITAGTEVRPVPGLFVSVEGFWKKLDDLVVHTDAFDSRGNALNLDNAGVGHVYGLEFLVRKELTDRAFGWIAYSFSRSDRVDRPGQATRLFDFDQTHNFTAVAGYKLGRGWQIGGRLRLISGNPDTPVVGSTYLASTDSYLPIHGATNSARSPLFSQFDVRIDKIWTYDKWMLDAYLDVLNASNHRSIEGVAWSYDFSQQAKVQGLPIFPSLGLKASF
jgi:TonB family protein